MERLGVVGVPWKKSAPMMDETQATRLLALAITALDHGDPAHAKELVKLAIEFMDRSMARKSIGQRQQQNPSKKEEE
jgi:hypothetical protein